MQVRGPLMVEHRLIEKLIALIDSQLAQARRNGTIDPYFIDTAVDFMLIYADRTHHGKEEEIYFKALASLPLSEADAGVMKQLIGEHAKFRDTSAALAAANTRYRAQDPAAFSELVTLLQTFVDFYPGHIAMEDKVFFPAAHAYLSDAQEQALLAEFWEFDRKLIHDKYKQVVQAAQAKYSAPA
ncbi:MAG: hemerythrin domain-containing protein [Anaerolineae bacterium]